MKKLFTTVFLLMWIISVSFVNLLRIWFRKLPLLIRGLLLLLPLAFYFYRFLLLDPKSIRGIQVVPELVLRCSHQAGPVLGP